MGLTARQLIFGYMGVTVSAYIAIPAVAPIALSGFYSYNGMGMARPYK
nr:PrgI family protein [Eubacterium xylanophilum]